jgi:LacI family transcriptional regulator
MRSRRPTIRDVAQAAGVSTVTVSRVNNEPDLVVVSTRERVHAAMRTLGYVPNLAARTMRTNATHTIGFLVPDLTIYPNAAVAQAAARRLAEAGYALLLASSDQRPEREIEALSILRTRQVDGMMLYLCDQEHPSLMAAVRNLDVPHILLDRDMPGQADRIYSDHRDVMHDIVRRLTNLGHRRIALLQYDMRIRPSVERRSAFSEAMEQAGIPTADQIVLRLPMEVGTSRTLQQALFTNERLPTAAIVEGSRLLLRTIQMARQRAIVIPQHLSLVGIDADDVATAATPEISCVLRDFEAIGKAAAEVMLARLQDRDAPRVVTHLPSHISSRFSMAPPPAS